MPESGLPLVTVAMVTYKSAPYVRMAIESVLASSYTNFELIISDDCSPDNTWDIICEYKDPCIRASRNEKNIGEYPNRNKCIDLAKGKYFIFIDGDDVILPHGLQTYVLFAEKYTGVGMIIQKGYFNNIVFPICLSPIELLRWEYSNRGLLSSSFSSNLFVTEILKKEGGLSNNYRSGDEEIRLRLCIKFNTLFIPGWLTWPRETPGQASLSLSDGTGLAEAYKMHSQFFNKCSNNEINIYLQFKLYNLKKQIRIEALKAIIKGNFTKWKILLEVLKAEYKWKPIHALDNLQSVKRYIPADPFFKSTDLFMLRNGK
jgi:glycosyltransferase involved in cell wall biosynthesis